MTINVVCAHFGSIVARTQGQVWEQWPWMLTKWCDEAVVVVKGREREAVSMSMVVSSWNTVGDSGCVLCNTQPPRTVCRVKTYLSIVCLCGAVVSCLIASGCNG